MRLLWYKRNALKDVCSMDFSLNRTGGAYSAPPDPLAGLKGAYQVLLRGGEGKKGGVPSNKNLPLHHCL